MVRDQGFLQDVRILIQLNTLDGVEGANVEILGTIHVDR